MGAICTKPDDIGVLVSAHEVFDDEGQSDDHPDEGRAAQTEPEEPPSAKSIYPCSSARASSGGEEEQPAVVQERTRDTAQRGSSGRTSEAGAQASSPAPSVRYPDPNAEGPAAPNAGPEPACSRRSESAQASDQLKQDSSTAKEPDVSASDPEAKRSSGQPALPDLANHEAMSTGAWGSSSEQAGPAARLRAVPSPIVPPTRADTLSSAQSIGSQLQSRLSTGSVATPTAICLQSASPVPPSVTRTDSYQPAPRPSRYAPGESQSALPSPAAPAQRPPRRPVSAASAAGAARARAGPNARGLVSASTPASLPDTPVPASLGTKVPVRRKKKKPILPMDPSQQNGANAPPSPDVYRLSQVSMSCESISGEALGFPAPCYPAPNPAKQHMKHNRPRESESQVASPVPRGASAFAPSLPGPRDSMDLSELNASLPASNFATRRPSPQRSMMLHARESGSFASQGGHIDMQRAAEAMRRLAAESSLAGEASHASLICPSPSVRRPPQHTRTTSDTLPLSQPGIALSRSALSSLHHAGSAPHQPIGPLSDTQLHQQPHDNHHNNKHATNSVPTTRNNSNSTQDGAECKHAELQGAASGQSVVPGSEVRAGSVAQAAAAPAEPPAGAAEAQAAAPADAAVQPAAGSLAAAPATAAAAAAATHDTHDPPHHTHQKSDDTGPSHTEQKCDGEPSHSDSHSQQGSDMPPAGGCEYVMASAWQPRDCVIPEEEEGQLLDRSSDAAYTDPGYFTHAAHQHQQHTVSLGTSPPGQSDPTAAHHAPLHHTHTAFSALGLPPRGAGVSVRQSGKGHSSSLRLPARGGSSGDASLSKRLLRYQLAGSEAARRRMSLPMVMTATGSHHGGASSAAMSLKARSHKSGDATSEDLSGTGNGFGMSLYSSADTEDTEARFMSIQSRLAKTPSDMNTARRNRFDPYRTCSSDESEDRLLGPSQEAMERFSSLLPPSRLTQGGVLPSTPWTDETRSRTQSTALTDLPTPTQPNTYTAITTATTNILQLQPDPSPPSTNTLHDNNTYNANNVPASASDRTSSSVASMAEEIGPLMRLPSTGISGAGGSCGVIGPVSAPLDTLQPAVGSGEWMIKRSESQAGALRGLGTPQKSLASTSSRVPSGCLTDDNTLADLIRSLRRHRSSASQVDLGGSLGRAASLAASMRARLRPGSSSCQASEAGIVDTWPASTDVDVVRTGSHLASVSRTQSEVTAVRAGSHESSADRTGSHTTSGDHLEPNATSTVNRGGSGSVDHVGPNATNTVDTAKSDAPVLGEKDGAWATGAQGSEPQVSVLTRQASSLRRPATVPTQSDAGRLSARNSLLLESVQGELPHAVTQVKDGERDMPPTSAVPEVLPAADCGAVAVTNGTKSGDQGAVTPLAKDTRVVSVVAAQGEAVAAGLGEAGAPVAVSTSDEDALIAL